MTDEQQQLIQRLKCLVGRHEWIRFEAYLNSKRNPTLDVVGCPHCHKVKGGPLEQPLPDAGRTTQMDLELGGELFTTHAKQRLVRGDY